MSYIESATIFNNNMTQLADSIRNKSKTIGKQSIVQMKEAVESISTFDDAPRYDGEYEIVSLPKPILNDNSWEIISTCSKEDIASSLWAIGDTKTITLSGTCLGEDISGQYNVYIIGFNHNSSVEGNGITFGTFKSTSGTDIALVKAYESYGLSTTAYYNMCGSNTTNGNSDYGTNYLGWKNTFMRYNILGSTDNFTLNSTSANFDASTNTAISPKSNTLMSCLPSDLRAVMKPMTIYTDNKGQANNNNSSAISATIDYLPLLSEYEVYGTKNYANSNEQSKQAQYSYYKNGNSKIKYQHNSTDSACYWWLRSPFFDSTCGFCLVRTNGSISNNFPGYSHGVAPIFKV